MNEGIDLAITTAKVMTWNNLAASLAVHGISAAYNIAQLARYRVQYLSQMKAVSYGITNNGVILMEEYRREMCKHAFLAGLDCLYLLFSGLSQLQERRDL